MNVKAQTVFRVDGPLPTEQGAVPAHADLLRYDLAFHDPADPRRVIFPSLRSRHGLIKGRATVERWAAQGWTLRRTRQKVARCGHWITYRTPPGDECGPLQAVTLSAFLQETKNRIA